MEELVDRMVILILPGFQADKRGLRYARSDESGLWRRKRRHTSVVK